MIEHLHKLGVTSVELLPIHTFVDDSYLLDKGLRNYWGYNTISFFAPEPLYAQRAGFRLSEFKEMVAQLHDAGIEVILDVVYNHTAEGNELGPTLSFKGIDNASYYRLLPDKPRYYINDTGTGNTLNLSHQRVLQMVTDSLRYWVKEMHVDGFRFDLATILAREPYGFDEERRLPRFLPAGSGAVVGEADCGALGLRTGRLSGRRLPARLGGMERPLSRYGALLLEGRRRHAAGSRARASPRPPTCSTCAGASPGRASISSPRTTASRSTISSPITTSTTMRTAKTIATATPTIIPGITAPKGRPTTRASSSCANGRSAIMLATLLLSQGTPMLLGGDEFGRTQKGNNNAYCQDNEISWVNWQIGEDGEALSRFVGQLTALRPPLSGAAAEPVLDRAVE